MGPPQGQFGKCENDYGAVSDHAERRKRLASAAVVFPLFVCTDTVTQKQRHLLPIRNAGA
jgi:hypothetical protein